MEDTSNEKLNNQKSEEKPPKRKLTIDENNGNNEECRREPLTKASCSESSGCDEEFGVTSHSIISEEKPPKRKLTIDENNGNNKECERELLAKVSGSESSGCDEELGVTSNSIIYEEKPPKRKLKNDGNNKECEREPLAKAGHSESSGCDEKLGVTSYSIISEEKPPKRKLKNDENNSNNEECEREPLAKAGRSESSGCDEKLCVTSYSIISEGEELIKDKNVLCVSGSKDLCAKPVDCVAYTDSEIIVLSKEEIIRQAWKKRSKEKKKKWKARKRLAAEQGHLLKSYNVECKIKYNYSGNGSREMEKNTKKFDCEANERRSRTVDNMCREENHSIINDDVCSIEIETGTAASKNENIYSKNDKIVSAVINDEKDIDKKNSVIKEVQIAPVINDGDSANDNNMDKTIIKEVQIAPVINDGKDSIIKNDMDKTILKEVQIAPVINDGDSANDNNMDKTIIKEVQIAPVINECENSVNENDMVKTIINEVQITSEKYFETENEFSKMIKDCDNEFRSTRSSKVENNSKKSRVEGCKTELLDNLLDLELNQESSTVNKTFNETLAVESEISAVESETSAVESDVESETSSVESKVSIDNNKKKKVTLEDSSSKQSQKAPLLNRKILPEKVDRDLQVVVMPKDGSSLTRDRFTLIHEEFMDSMLKALLDSDKENSTAPVLQYHKTGLVEEGWCLISCLTKETKDWTLKWKPKDSDLVVLPEAEVKWPIKIRIWVKSLAAVNIIRLTQRLRTQNRDAKVETWRHLSTRQGKLKFWQVTFAVSLKVANHLFRENLMIAYKTSFLKVSLSYRGRL